MKNIFVKKKREQECTGTNSGQCRVGYGSVLLEIDWLHQRFVVHNCLVGATREGRMVQCYACGKAMTDGK